jgi:hypothetical protein
MHVFFNFIKTPQSLCYDTTIKDKNIIVHDAVSNDTEFHHSFRKCGELANYFIKKLAELRRSVRRKNTCMERFCNSFWQRDSGTKNRFTIWNRARRRIER